MIDINLIREKPELVKQSIKKRFKEDKLKLVDEIKGLDEKWRKSKFEEDNLRSQRNKISEEINQAKKKKDEKKAKELLAKAKKIPEDIEKIQIKRKEMEEKISILVNALPKELQRLARDKVNRIMCGENVVDISETRLQKGVKKKVVNETS